MLSSGRAVLPISRQGKTFIGGIMVSELYGVLKFLLGVEFALLAAYALGSVLNLIRMDHVVRESYVLRVEIFNTLSETYLKGRSLLEEQEEQRRKQAENAEEVEAA